MKKNSFKLGTYAALLVAGISVLALGGCEDEPVAPKLPTTSEKICANNWEVS